ncbi:hypothetical protein ACQP1O_10705 [Nocardia sp. CA-151230]|uniref:hypothetical protein n=1 Tax=Nocardia sp. CA-151230 TaxID=3239982 RepID=UPI003D8E7A99
MNMSVLARSTVGIAAAAAMGVATIVSATTASAAMTIQPSQAYCVGTAYTITIPAADAAALETDPSYNTINFNYELPSGSNPSAGAIGIVPWTSGKDVTVQWTPSQAVPTSIRAVNFNGTYPGNAQLTTAPINIVASAPAGASCTPTPASPAGTGSASSIPVIGGLLSSLSAQK